MCVCVCVSGEGGERVPMGVLAAAVRSLPAKGSQKGLRELRSEAEKTGIGKKYRQRRV